MRGGFQGVWWTDSGSVKPLAITAAAAAAVSWIATVLWILAIILALVLALSVAGVIVLRRSTDRDGDRELLGARAAAVRAEAGEGRHVTAPGPLTVINVAPGAHVHLEAGAPVAGSIRPAVHGAVIRKENH